MNNDIFATLGGGILRPPTAEDVFQDTCCSGTAQNDPYCYSALKDSMRAMRKAIKIDLAEEVPFEVVE